MQKSANLYDVKDQNRKLVLDLLRRRPRSRTDLAQATGLTRQAMSLIADRLLDEGLIVEAGRQEGGVGRNPTLLEIRPDDRYIAGINLTRVRADIGIADLQGNVLCGRTILVAGAAPQALLAQIGDILQQQLADFPSDKLLGLGVSAPGPLDYRSGLVCNPPGFPGWCNIPVGEILTGLTGLPVLVENVADAMALEELYFGCCKEQSNFLVMLVDEEIGAGIVVNGALYRGRAGFGGEIGHISIQYDGRRCECGNRGCLSRYAAVPEILRGTTYTGWSALVDAVGRDTAASELLEREAEYLSAAMVTAINLLDLERILIGGEISYQPQRLLAAIGKRLRERVITHAAQAGDLLGYTDNRGGVRTAIMPVVADFYTHRNA